MTAAVAQFTPTTECPTGSVRVQIKVLPHGEGLPLPTYNTEHAAAVDLIAAVPQDASMTLLPGKFAGVPTGLSFGIPNGYEMQIRGRSGLAARMGISCTHGVGTIDADYRGEVFVLLINHGEQPLVIERGMRIAQAVVTPVPRIQWDVVDALSDTTRGTGGLGSTGIK